MLAITSLLLLGPARLHAQVNTATLQGVVTDTAGAAVGGASIVITNTDTQVAHTTVSDSAGEYHVSALPPGNYSLSVTLTGFSKEEQTGIKLEVGQVADLPISLKIGSTSQTVEVATTSTSIENDDATLGTVITQQQVVDLPLNGRQFSQLLQLAPGVVPIDVSQNAGKAPSFGAGASSPGIDGQPNRSNLFYLDGVIDSNPFFGGYSFNPSIDDIQEFKVQSHTDEAEFGMATGGIVSVITRPGTNQFHGEIFEFNRNTIFNTQIRTFNGPQPKFAYHQNQFGGSFGGPILKDKLFFFANYEGGRQVQPSPSQSTVPTGDELSGNFGGTLPGNITRTIYDPATFNPTTLTETPFQGNTIPTQRLDTGMLALLKGVYPAANEPLNSAGVNNFQANTGTVGIGDQGSVRIDYTLGTKDNFNGRYSQNQTTNSSASSLNNIFATGFNGKNYGGSWVHTYSPSLISDVTVAKNNLNIPQAIVMPEDENAIFDAAGLGAGFNKNPGLTPFTEVPGFGLGGGGSAYSGFWNGAGPIGPMAITQVTGSLAKTESHHALKFGGSFFHTAMYTNWSGNNMDFNSKATANAACQYVQTDANGNPIPSLAYTNCPTYNSKLSDLGAGGDPVASMLLSLPIDANRNLGNSGVNLRQSLVTAFGQDTWSITPKVTVNYGLRWDYTTPVTEANNRMAWYNIYTHQFVLAKGDVDAPSGTLPANVVFSSTNHITDSHWDYFQPRIGIAYQLTAKTTLRIGAGRSFDTWGLPLQVAQQDRGAWPSGLSQNASSQQLNVSGISYKPDGTPVTGENPFYGAAVLPASPLPYPGLSFEDTKWQPASSVQWNAEVQQDFGRIGSFNLAYVGAHTEHAMVYMPYDLAHASQNSTDKVYPDLILGGPSNIEQSIGNSNYNSLQAKLSKAYANGLVYNATFTYSQTLAVASCGDAFSTCVQDPYNLSADYGRSVLDVPLIATFNAAYQLPFGKGKSYVTEGPGAYLLGNWQLNTIFTTRSGTVINPTCGCDSANAGGGTERISFVSDPNKGATHNINQYFNPAAFAEPAPGTYGNAGINSLRGPAFWNDDFSVFRDFPIRERLKIQFRAEAFNVFNHVNLGNPNGQVGGGFNQITSVQNTNRVIQFAGKLIF